MGALKRVRDLAVRAVEWMIIGLVALLTLDVLWGVFTRFVLGSGLAHKMLSGVIPETHLGQAVYTDELACVLLVWISMLGAALAFGRKAHLGVDFFVGKLHPEAAKILCVVVQLVIICVTVTVFLIGGWKLAMSQMGQELSTMRWLTRGQVYFALLLSGILILMFTLENLVKVLLSPADQLSGKTQSEA